jgi:hypothetical protein
LRGSVQRRDANLQRERGKPMTCIVGKKQALQKVLRKLGKLQRKVDAMSIQTDKIAADLTAIGQNVQTYVTGAIAAAASAKALTDAQKAQIDMLTGEVAADAATIQAGKDNLATLQAQYDASVAASLADETAVGEAADALSAAVAALNAAPAVEPVPAVPPVAVPDPNAPPAV